MTFKPIGAMMLYCVECERAIPAREGQEHTCDTLGDPNTGMSWETYLNKIDS